MNINDEFIVKIEKMINEGKGLARIDSIPVFIDNTAPEDILKIKIVKTNKKYCVGEIIEIIEASKHRIAPVCSMHNVCGSCNWQHIDYEEQLKQKKNIVFETLKNITGIEFAILDTIPSPKISEYRCKIQYPVSQRKSGRIVSGYYKKNSHELVNIKYCPMQNSLVNEITEFIKEKATELNISGYNEKNHTGYLKHFIFRLNSNCNELLIIFVVNSEIITKDIRKLSEILAEKYSIIKGICVNFNSKRTNVIMGKETKILLGYSYYNEQLSNKTYKISSNSFFQVNPYCAELIFDKVKSLISKNIENPTILDAYSGVSSFGIWLSDIAKEVTCVEEVVSASNDAIDNVKINKLSNVKIINGDAGKTFENMIKNNQKFDVTVIDPPRKGCDDKAINNVTALTDKYLIYVSCNVSTLARDLKILMEKSFNPVFIQPADMFPNTYHVETIVLLEKIQ